MKRKQGFGFDNAHRRSSRLGPHTPGEGSARREASLSVECTLTGGDSGDGTTPHTTAAEERREDPTRKQGKKSKTRARGGGGRAERGISIYRALESEGTHVLRGRESEGRGAAALQAREHGGGQPHHRRPLLGQPPGRRLQRELHNKRRTDPPRRENSPDLLSGGFPPPPPCAISFLSPSRISALDHRKRRKRRRRRPSPQRGGALDVLLSPSTPGSVATRHARKEVSVGA